MEIKNIDKYSISDDCMVKVTEMGNVTEIMYLERKNNKATIQRLDKTHYMKISTGEVFEVQPSDSRKSNQNSLRQTFRRLRNLINSNVVDTNKVRWITLTYAENMTDTKRLYEDFNKFIKRMKYYCKTEDIKPFEYIVAMEPQGRGAWHSHLLMIWDCKAPYIANDTLAALWGYGFVTIKALDDVDNIGAYLTAYLGDMELTEANEQCLVKSDDVFKTVDIKGNKKSFVKGARLSMYPPGFNLYRHSRGVKEPKEYYMPYEEIKKASVGALTYKSAIAISDDDYSNTICKEYYNKKR